MKDLASPNSGATISHVTGQHTSFPASNILKDHSCWVSTGTFPQSFTLSLQTTCQVQEVAIETYNAKQVELSSSVENTPKNFERVETSVLEATDNRRQEHQLFIAGKNGKLTARHIRITTNSGHGPFIAVYSLKVLGEVGQGKSTSKAKEGGKDAAGFNFGTGSTGSKFGTAFSTQPIQPDSGSFGGFQTTARERVPSPPIPTVQARFQELDSVPAQGTAAVWADGEPEMGRDEVMVFDRDE